MCPREGLVVSSVSGQLDSELYYSPWVLRAAWRKVQSWYEHGEWYDPAERLAWDSDPWAHLASVSADLAGDRYAVGPVPMIPYPKKNEQTRHYVMPSIRDQVAFATYLVLLAPFLEARMPNVSLGNRLFRPKVLMKPRQRGGAGSSDGERWFRLPFSLGHSRLYDRFSSGYGLFRRLLQWLVNDAVLGSTGANDSRADLDEEDPDLLPYSQLCCGRGPWSGDKGSSLFYVRLDLAAAYPSVNRGELLNDLLCLLSSNEVCSERFPERLPELRHQTIWGLPDFPSLELRGSLSPYSRFIEPCRPTLGKHPWHELAKNEEDRRELAVRLHSLLDQVQYAPWAEPSGWLGNRMAPGISSRSDLVDGATLLPDASVRTTEDEEAVQRWDTGGIWRPNCHLPPELLMTWKYGLPTGLAISGVLLNVALASVDRRMCQLYEEACSTGQPRVVYLRFVDDIVLLSQDWDALGRALDVLIHALKTYHRFEVNTEKVRPEILRGHFKRFYEVHPTTRSDFDMNGWRSVRPPANSDSYLTRVNADIFTTAVVREMSDLAEEDLDERFGGHSVERIERLLELAARTDPDEEVAADARLAFAVNKIARATWPDGKVLIDGVIRDPSSFARQIMLGAERALRKHPWRFRLWKALLIIALRAPSENGCSSGQRWLEDQILPLLRWHTGAEGSGAEAWESSDGTESLMNIQEQEPQSTYHGAVSSQVAERRCQHRRLRVSFHRAHFWRQWAACVRALQRVSTDERASHQSWDAWVLHFTPESAAKTLAWFADIKRWMGVLYANPPSGYWPSDGPFLWWWEAEALSDAMLAVLPPSRELFRILGNPEAGTLRRKDCLSITDLHSLLPQGDEYSDFRIAIGRILHWHTEEGEQQLRTPLGSAGSDTNRALLWWVRCSRTAAHAVDHVPPQFAADLPKPDDVCAWAALARLGLWDEWKDLGSYMRGPFRRRSFSYSRRWDCVLALDEYAMTRRLALAHGVPVRWRDFRPLFGRVLAGKLFAGRTRRHVTLLEAMYCVSSEDGKLVLEDALVPAIGLPWPLALTLATGSLERRGTQRRPGFISPDTVVLSSDAAESITVARQNLLQMSSRPRLRVHEDVAAKYMALLSDECGRHGTHPHLLGNHVRAVTPLCSTSRAPHPLFLFPYLFFDRDDETPRAKWCAALLLLWMGTGGEQYLDRLYEEVPWQPPLIERDTWRSELVLPRQLWCALDEALGSNSLRAVQTQMDESTLLSIRRTWLRGDEASRNIKVHDVFLSPDGDWDLTDPSNGPQQYFMEEYASYLRVCLVQMCKSPDYRRLFSSVDGSALLEDVGTLCDVSAEIGERLREVRFRAQRLVESPMGAQNEEYAAVDDTQLGPDDLVIFPEWSVPHQYTRSLAHFVGETGVGVLAGLTPRELPRAVPAAHEVRRKGIHVLVNEAVLIIPGFSNQPHRGRACRRVFTFRIRKPYASVHELGLVRYLTGKSQPHARWEFVPGLSWYRFTYPGWGSFSVAICSDILDTFIWDWLRGRIQHLFVVAHNQDIDLFDQVTWARSYELFANVVVVNHGSCSGGTLAWTPKHGHDKEVFAARGENIPLSVVVRLPVKSLITHQESGLESGVKFQLAEWQRMIEGSEPPKDKTRFKTPAPGYRLMLLPRPAPQSQCSPAIPSATLPPGGQTAGAAIPRADEEVAAAEGNGNDDHESCQDRTS